MKSVDLHENTAAAPARRDASGSRYERWWRCGSSGPSASFTSTTQGRPWTPRRLRSGPRPR